MGKETIEGACCPLTGCPIKKLVWSWLAIFLTIFAYEWVFHGMYMMADYAATAEMWRDETAMQELFHVALIRQAIVAFIIAALYGWATSTQHGCCTKFDIKFGLMIGLLFGITSFSVYAYMPIPYEMALKWLIGETLMGLIIGVVLSFVGKCCKK